MMIVDTILESLLKNLMDLAKQKVELIAGLKNQVERLISELGMLKAFLKDSAAVKYQNETFKEYVRQIRVIVFKAEDVIEEFVVQAAMQKAKNLVGKAFHMVDHAPFHLRLAENIRSIRELLNDMKNNQNLTIGVLQVVGTPNCIDSWQPAAAAAGANEELEERVVGFEGEARVLVGRLTGGSEKLEIIAVTGMAGIGKTTLAKKILCNSSITSHFKNRAYASLSNGLDQKRLFLQILSGITTITDEIERMSKERLADKLKQLLGQEKFLVVIDDVWSEDAWDYVISIFPKKDNGNRILLTTRTTEVALHATGKNSLYNLPFLTDDESWDLLCKRIFDREGCPPHLKEVGIKIAKKCFGLPLAVLAIARHLKRNDDTRDWYWNRVLSNGVASYIASEPKQCIDVLAQSYKNLPNHLKICLIYFATFPEDFRIPAWQLLRLWVAEGFIEEKEKECLEDTAEGYLEALVRRNLILVSKKRSNGRVKTCWIHEILRQFCLIQAAEEKFLQEIESSRRREDSSENPRRLSIRNHSQSLETLPSSPTGSNVRSIFYFALKLSEIEDKKASSFFQTFQLLRVLDIRSIYLSRFPKEITNLVLLRYIALFGRFDILPRLIANLWNLQTLIVETVTKSLDIQVDLWVMRHLRHIHTNCPSLLRGPPTKKPRKAKQELIAQNLQTISMVQPESCTNNVLSMTPNLKKLSIRGKLITLVEEKNGASLFDNLSVCNCLETLKLLNYNTQDRDDPSGVGALPYLPKDYKFPKNLKSLTLSNTSLNWNAMSTLGKLQYLEVLKLKDNAFQGAEWTPLDGGFRLLKILHIGETDLVHWGASHVHFPILQRLVLKNCKKLVEIPQDIGVGAALQILELYWTSPSAAASARRIHQQQRQLKLRIHPPGL